MWQRFTERARKAVFYAQEEAIKWGENSVSPEHLLLGLIREDDSFAARILERLGVSRDLIRSEVERQLTRSDGRLGQDMQLTTAAKKVVDLAYGEGKRLRNNYIGGEHLLLALLAEGEGLAARVLTELGLTLDATREQVRKFQEEAEAKTASEELLSLDEAVKFLGTSKPTLYRLLGQDEIKGLKVGRQWRFRRADLVAYMERSPVAVAAAPKEDLDMELAFFAQQLSEPEADGIASPETKTIRLAHKIMQLAISAKASDIHLEPTREDFGLRLRVDGVLQETRRLPISVRESLTAQFKTMAEMDVNEKRLPQDGRIPLRYEDKDFTVRVASVPSIYGESIAMQVSAKQDLLVTLDSLALTPNDLTQLRDLLRRPYGLILAAGPNGSGKMSLLYSCLQDIAGGEKKEVTIEDPIEQILPHVTQVQVNKKGGLTFAAGLRALLQQDPDVILVGTLSDSETAALAAEAALTGHLVLSALQVGDAPSALLQLMDLGLPPHLVTSTVVGVVAMRLCRRLCDHCKAPADISDEPTLSHVIRLAREGGYDAPPSAVFYQGRGCERCRGRGYAGRIALYEVLTMSSALAEALLSRAPAEELMALAVAGGMRTLLADGIRKAVDGQTTVEEVLRVVSVSA
jgi:excisionase family DNA binding protein